MKALAVVLTLALSLPARAIDCAELSDPEPGALSADQLECIRRAIVNLRHERDVEHAEAVKQAQLAAACEATASITCPPAPLPVVPVVVTAGIGIVAVVIAYVVGFVHGASR